MKVFVWERVAELTDNYHPKGGVVVFADTVERARELVGVVTLGVAMLGAPDDVREADGEEKVYIFPDAGCC